MFILIAQLLVSELFASGCLDPSILKLVGCKFNARTFLAYWGIESPLPGTV